MSTVVFVVGVLSQLLLVLIALSWKFAVVVVIGGMVSAGSGDQCNRQKKQGREIPVH